MNSRRVSVAELDGRLAVMDGLIKQLAAQIGAHESWHRDMLVRAGESGSSKRLAMWALFLAAVSAAAAVLLALATLIR